MAFKCLAKGCTSTGKTKLDGVKIVFYPFPTDKNLKNQWKRICAPSNAKKKAYLCELHFHISAFDSTKELKPDAVPTIEFLKNNANHETTTISDCEPARKKSKTLESDDDKPSKAKPFLLTIEITKKVVQPSPLSENISQTKSQPSHANCSQDSQEQTVIFENGKDKQNNLQCLVCKESFSDITNLYRHNKVHFTCDICNTEFTSRNKYKNHYKLHESHKEQCLYKCHICKLLFESKDELSKHNHVTLDNLNEDSEEIRLHYCDSCNMTFSDEVLFSDHLTSHLGSWYVDTHEQLRCSMLHTDG